MRVLTIRHVPFEDLSAWAAPLAKRGFQNTYVEAAIGALAAHDPLAADLLVIGGGPLGVYDAPDYPFLSEEIDFIRRRIEADKPTIGVCLGSQLLAAAAGARVYPSGTSEIGIMPITLTDAGRASCLAPFADEPLTLHWHGDTFDLPVGATLLASTDKVKHQAYALGDRVLGVQFHPEWGAAPLEPWLIGHTGNLRGDKIDVAAFREKAEAERSALAAKAERVLAAYLAGAGLA